MLDPGPDLRGSGPDDIPLDQRDSRPVPVRSPRAVQSGPEHLPLVLRSGSAALTSHPRLGSGRAVLDSRGGLPGRVACGACSVGARHFGGFMTVDTVKVPDDVKVHDDGRARPSGTDQPKARGHNHGTVETAIVLQGGGALGAYEYGVLKALYEQRPGFKPVAVTGISIGAITAAVLGGAKGNPISAVDRLWRDKLTVSPPLPIPWLPVQSDQSLAVLGNPGMYRLDAALFTAPWMSTSIYDTAPMRQTLTELVDLEALNDEDTRVSVG